MNPAEWIVSRIGARVFGRRRSVYTLGSSAHAATTVQGAKLPGFLALGPDVAAHFGNFDLGVKITNLTNQRYFLGGPHDADAGSDDSGSTGFCQSVVPQPGRQIQVQLTLGI